MFGGGDRIAERRIHDDDAAGGSRRNIDVVDADAGAPDHFEVLGLIQKLARNLGRGADRQSIEAIDRGGKLVFVLAETGRKLHVEAAILENRDRRRRQGIGNKDSRRHAFILLKARLSS